MSRIPLLPLVMSRFLAWTSEPNRLVAAIAFRASRSGPQVLARARRETTDVAQVGVNLGKEPRAVEMDLAGLLADGASLRSALGESTFDPVPESRKIRWRLPALSTSILAP